MNSSRHSTAASHGLLWVIPSPHVQALFLFRCAWGHRLVCLATCPKVSSSVNIQDSYSSHPPYRQFSCLYLCTLITWYHSNTEAHEPCQFYFQHSSVPTKKLKSPESSGKGGRFHAVFHMYMLIKFSLSTPHSCCIIRIKGAFDNLPGTAITMRQWGSHHNYPQLRMRTLRLRERHRLDQESKGMAQAESPRPHALNLDVTKATETCPQKRPFKIWWS